ncbi:MotA/TolQ/ExbB proton channel family protein [Hydrogenimonas sp.]|uniref:MotA/TolQ/ExbB proton channel family protein n=1 Tax=Hydrogenimonas sp. TaxID=2231112 RepID=UPI00261E1B7A|nr:MotA/TolQ/ExbB proton channel family protein [Hydrogenimonas sp.]
MSLMHYIESGGIIMEVLVVMNTIGIAVMVTKWVQFLRFNSRKKYHADQIVKDFSGLGSNDRDTLLLIIKELLQSRLKRLESGMPTIKIIATTATLFGLLGTVVGVLMAFEAIAKIGMGDPSVFANGISMALVTTVGGLIVAIIHTIGYNYLIAYLDTIEANIEAELLLRFYGERE